MNEAYLKHAIFDYVWRQWEAWNNALFAGRIPPPKDIYIEFGGVWNPDDTHGAHIARWTPAISQLAINYPAFRADVTYREHQAGYKMDYWLYLSDWTLHEQLHASGVYEHGIEWQVKCQAVADRLGLSFLPHQTPARRAEALRSPAVQRAMWHLFPLFHRDPDYYRRTGDHSVIFALNDLMDS